MLPAKAVPSSYKRPRKLLESETALDLDEHNGLRLALVADTHSSPHPNAARFITELAPRAILHAGDIGNLSVLDDLIREDVKAKAVQRIYTHLRRCVTPKRRPRSCPRAVRQPVKGWPRLLHNQSVEGPLHFTIR